MACDWTTDQSCIISSTVEGIINALDIKTNKMIMTHDTMEFNPDLPSNIIYSLKSVRHHPMKGNIFTVGSELRNAYLCEFDPTAKFESWLLEIKQKYEGHSAGLRDIQFSPDCNRMLTSCEDHSLRLWNP